MNSQGGAARRRRASAAAVGDLLVTLQRRPGGCTPMHPSLAKHEVLSPAWTNMVSIQRVFAMYSPSGTCQIRRKR